jgi:tripartite-type tricarboxylate transporter receptor subunit TctC
VFRNASFLISLAVSSVLASVTQAGAQDYPNRTITLIAPYAAGGGFDGVARILAESMGRNLGQRIVVLNTEGAGGTIGARQGARAAPDGYTLLLHHPGMVTSTLLMKNLQFDPIQSYEHVGLFLYSPALLVGRNNLPANTIQELIGYIKANQDKVTMASSGVGSGTHLCAMLLEQAIGHKITHVQYRGAGPAMIDVQAERVDLLCETPFALVSHIRSGHVKAFVVSGEKMLESLPDTPIASQSGLGALDLGVTWYGLYAPAKTPAPIVERLSQALQAATQDPVVLERTQRLEMTAFKPEQATPNGLRRQLSSQIELLGDVFRKAGIQPQ